MLVDMIAGVSGPLLVVGAAVYAAVLLHLVARDTERARWQRQFGSWRTLQQDRMALSLRLAGHLDQRRFEHHRGTGWNVLQRHRLARRRCDRASR